MINEKCRELGDELMVKNIKKFFWQRSVINWREIRQNWSFDTVKIIIG